MRKHKYHSCSEDYLEGPESPTESTSVLNPCNATTFRYHAHPVDLKELARILGYAEHYRQGPILSRDPYVKFFRMEIAGQPAVMLRHNNIDYYFVQAESPLRKHFSWVQMELPLEVLNAH